MLLEDLSFYMVDIITNLRTIDRKYSLRKAWIGNDLSTRERAQAIMQHMEYKPWVSDSKENFMVRLNTCIRPDFIEERNDQVQHLYGLALSGVSHFNNGYGKAEGLQIRLEFRAFFETVLSLILTQRSTTVSSSTSSIENSRGPYWGSSPLDSLMDSPLMQKHRKQQQKLQGNIVYHTEQPKGITRFRRRQEPSQEPTQPDHITFDLGPQPQQQQPREVNDSCYVEQPTGNTWLERHGITATYEPKPKKRRGAFGRLFRKFNMWLCSESVTEYRMRRGGLSAMDDARPRGDMSPRPGTEERYPERIVGSTR
ncbi:hypothetical protein PG994_001774 [Apiospora phragmitis]|uniref:Ras-GEF domain-containing protein n=1 Tax=Apiospora phragmitis TaxID=2905665 RepID=A0ABR1WUD6_9PEZI